MSLSALELLQAAVDPAGARVSKLPPIVLVFGGKLGGATIASARQMFINWAMVHAPHIASLINTPEAFDDWGSFEGYQNLIDFESDAGNLAQAIVLFSESEGSFAELGAFCMDDVLAERLFVVIERSHYVAPSFIAHGPIKKIERIDARSVCVVDSITPEEIQPQLGDVCHLIEEKINSSPKTVIFNPARSRDQFLLIADLVEMFGALTAHEIGLLLQFMGVDIPKNRLDQIIKQLLRFKLVVMVEKLRRFLVPPLERQHYIDYSADATQPPFDRARFKLKMAFPWLAKDNSRRLAYLEIHGGD